MNVSGRKRTRYEYRGHKIDPAVGFASPLVRRYKENYGIRDEVEVTEEMVHKHWDLERALTKTLLESSPDNRREVFADCYTRLYKELGWLNTLVRPKSMEERNRECAPWAEAISPVPARIYEIGSGRGELLEYLADQGHDCTGSEITEERGENLLGESTAKIRWRVGDGVNLTRYEQNATYDIVISNQLLEHLHPDDLDSHLAGVYAILRPRGGYVLSTPHRLTGPHDISRIFRRPLAEGMHLREYTYRELFSSLREHGFREVYHVGQWRRIRRLTGKSQERGGAAGVLLKMLTTALLLSETFLKLVPRRIRRPASALMRRLGIFSDNIFLVAVK